MSNTSIATATRGIDIGKNSFHVIGSDPRADLLREVVTRPDRSAARRMRQCLIGMEALCRANHPSGKLQVLGHDARLMPAKYVRAYSKGQKRFSRRGSDSIQRPTNETRRQQGEKTGDDLIEV